MCTPKAPKVQQDPETKKLRILLSRDRVGTGSTSGQATNTNSSPTTSPGQEPGLSINELLGVGVN